MKISGFLKYFKPNKNVQPEYIPTLWEDDYCQVELIPQENLAFIKKQVNEANSFAEEHKTEFGFTDMFVRDDTQVSLISKEIRVDYLRSALTSYKLPQLTNVRYEGGGSVSLRKIKALAFGYPDFTLFFSIEGKFVKKIWIKSISELEEKLDTIVSALYYLGEENDLILIDWNSDEIVDLKNRNQISKYLQG